jgi:hypothetical protein
MPDVSEPGEVFWLANRPTRPGLPAGDPKVAGSGWMGPFVLAYSGGTAVDLHHLPFTRFCLHLSGDQYNLCGGQVKGVRGL